MIAIITFYVLLEFMILLLTFVFAFSFVISVTPQPNLQWEHRNLFGPKNTLKFKIFVLTCGLKLINRVKY